MNVLTFKSVGTVFSSMLFPQMFWDVSVLHSALEWFQTGTLYAPLLFNTLCFWIRLTDIRWSACPWGCPFSITLGWPLPCQASWERDCQCQRCVPGHGINLRATLPQTKATAEYDWWMFPLALNNSCLSQVMSFYTRKMSTKQAARVFASILSDSFTTFLGRGFAGNCHGWHVWTTVWGFLYLGSQWLFLLLPFDSKHA